jgi:hypothetical protein
MSHLYLCRGVLRNMMGRALSDQMGCQSSHAAAPETEREKEVIQGFPIEL